MGACGGRKKEGVAGHAPQRESAGWVLCLEGFLSHLKAEILGEVSGECYSRISPSSTGVPFQAVVSTEWSATGQGVVSHCSWYGIAHLVLLLF